MESQRSAILRELAQNITNNSNRSVISSTGSDHGTVGSDDTLFSHESNESDFDVSYIQASIGLLDDFFGLAQSQRQPSPRSPSSKPVRKWKAPNDISIVTKRSTRSTSLSTTSNISASSTSSQQLPELPRQPPSERRQPCSPNVSNHYSIADTTASSIGLQPHLKIREELARLRQKARARAASMSDVTTNATASKAPIGRRRASVGSTQLFDTQQISQHISIMRETIEPTNNNTNTLPSSPFVQKPPKPDEREQNNTNTSYKSYMSSLPSESEYDNTQNSFCSDGAILHDEEASCRVISNPLRLSTITEGSQETSRKSSAEIPLQIPVHKSPPEMFTIVNALTAISFDNVPDLSENDFLATAFAITNSTEVTRVGKQSLDHEGKTILLTKNEEVINMSIEEAREEVKRLQTMIRALVSRGHDPEIASLQIGSTVERDAKHKYTTTSFPRNAVDTRAENERHNLELAALRLEVDKLKTENKTLNVEKEELNIKNKNMKAENAKLKMDNGTLTAQNKELKMECKPLRAEIGNLKVESEKLKSENERLKVECGTLNVEIEEFKAETTAKVMAFKAKGNARIEAIEAEAMAQLAEREGQFDELQGKAIDLEQNNLDLENRNSEMEARIKGLEEAKRELQLIMSTKERRALQVVDSSKAKNLELEGINKRLAGKVSRRERTIAQMKKEMEATAVLFEESLHRVESLKTISAGGMEILISVV